MNMTQKLPHALILGAALMASTLSCSLYAADATITFTGVITPAANGAKTAAASKESAPVANKGSETESRVQKGDKYAAR